MTTYGIKVSKPGKDISSTEPKDFVLNSEYGTAIILKEAEVSVTIAGSSSTKSTVTYDSALAFVPVVMVFVELTAGSGKWYLSPFTFTETDDPEDTTIDITTSATAIEDHQFYITFNNETASQKTIKYHYYLFANLA